jgi:uncharacterized protein involved in type VI secretion and phage assembly
VKGIETLLDSQETKDEIISGVVIGIVTSNKDDEGLGRVKVYFPWRNVKEENEKEESYWARIASLMAGDTRGCVFYPEVNDEVLVAFEHGDINHPYVIGALWNGKDKPPETNSDGNNNIRMIRSRSGHEIIMNDDSKSKQEKIEIHTNGKHKILLDDSSGAEKIEISTNGKHKILLDDSSGAEKIEIIDRTGSNKIVIDSNQNSINIESSMQLKIKANMVEIEGTSSLTLKSSAMLTIKGTPVQIN